MTGPLRMQPMHDLRVKANSQHEQEQAQWLVPGETPGRHRIEPREPAPMAAATSPGRFPRLRYLANRFSVPKGNTPNATPSGSELATRSTVPSPPAAMTARNLFWSNSFRVRARKHATSENTAGRNRRDLRSSTSSLQPLFARIRDLRIDFAV